MSDVEVIDRAEIVRREVDRESTERALAVIDPTVLDTIFGSRDPKAIIERIAEVSGVLMEAVRQRDLAMQFRRGDSEFLKIEAWQFLASQLGMTTLGVGEVLLPDGSGYKATAELQHIATGRVLGRRPGICQKTEPGKAAKSLNDLLEMAHIRAARHAARSVLGFVPRIGGFEISDPDAPATNDQVAVLHILEREIGWDHDQGHVEAGDVGSYRDLTREQASEVIERWTALRDEMSGSEPKPGHRPSSGGELRQDPDRKSGTVSTSLSGAGQGTPEQPEPVGGRQAEDSGVSDSVRPDPKDALGIRTVRCTHPEWIPVVGRAGLLKCRDCGVGKKARPGH